MSELAALFVMFVSGGSLGMSIEAIMQRRHQERIERLRRETP